LEAYIFFLHTNFLKLGVANYKYAIRFKKFLRFKMSNPIWRTENAKINLITWNRIFCSF